MSDEGKPVRIAFNITHGRVDHYSDVVEYLAATEIARFTQEHGHRPSPQQITFLKKELVRYAVIRHDLDTAQKIKIKSSVILNEKENNLSSRSK